MARSAAQAGAHACARTAPARSCRDWPGPPVRSRDAPRSVPTGFTSRRSTRSSGTVRFGQDYSMPESYGELEELRRENARLRKLLKLTETEAAPARGTQAAWFDRAPGTVDANSSPDAKMAFYAALFGGRRD